jgi:phosphomannomutase
VEFKRGIYIIENMAAIPGIFRAYDIRGVYPVEFDEEGAYDIARAFAALLGRENPDKRLKIAIGMDMRLSSPTIKKEVIRGLLEAGVDVDDVGLVSTPTFYFAVAYYGYDGGIQVSASHNPKEYNGMKLVRRGAASLSKDSGILDIRSMIEKKELPPPAAVPGQLGSREGVLGELLKVQIPSVAGIKPLRVVADAANAMGAEDLRVLFEALPCELVRMNFTLDGSFPAHEADPVKMENMAPLCAKVLEEKADLGIATDGDADRIAFVDEKGERVPLHILQAVLAEIELKEHPGATIVHDIRPGKIVKDTILAAGGKPVLAPVGSSIIKQMMLKEDAVFGGESSGHFFYKLPYGTFEAPILVAWKILRFLTEAGKPFSELLAPYKIYFHSGEINLHLPDRRAIEEKIESLKKEYSGGDQLFLDGISVEYPDFWFNVRASNTEPVLRLTVEARDAAVLARETEKLKNLISS